MKTILFAVFLALGSGVSAWAQDSSVAAPVGAVEVDPAYVSATPSPPVSGFRPLLTTPPPPQTVVAPVSDVPPVSPPVEQETVPVEPVAEEETTPPAILGKAFAPKENVVEVGDVGLEATQPIPPPDLPPLQGGRIKEGGVDVSAPESLPENQIVSFPVQVKTTSESLDPTVASGSEPITQSPAPTVEAEHIKDFGAMVKDAASALENASETKTPETKIVEEKKTGEKPAVSVVAADVPIPKRRPKSIAKIAAQAAKKDKSLPPAAPAKIRNMNLADAPHKVDLDDDHLSQSIADISTDELAAAIDAIDAGRAPKKPPQKAGSAQVRRIDAKPFGHKVKARKVEEAELEAIKHVENVEPAALSDMPSQGNTLSLSFAPAAEKLDKAALEVMKSDILPALRQDQTVRALVVAYAAPIAGGDVGSARRLSLSRAVAVRSYLLDKGIEAGRIDVRAQGVSESGASDRVDVTVLSADFFKNRTQ
jgi:outer membrane protein OmpA-like peptidoglycan-associated protein